MDLNTIFTNSKQILLQIEPLMSLIIAICVMYISYSQWLISKQNEYIESKKILNENLYTPIKEYGENINKLVNNTEESVKSLTQWIDELKKNLREISIFFTKTDFAILIEYTDLLKGVFQNFESNVTRKIDIFKQLVIIIYYFLIIRFIMLKLETPLYKPTIKIYTIIISFVNNVILFFLPDFIEKFIKKCFYNLIIIIKILRYLFFIFSNIFFKKDKKHVKLEK